MPTASQILNDALELPSAERAEVAHQLLLSLEPDDYEDAADVDRSWAIEIKRRLEAIRSGNAQLTDWDTALRRLKKSLTDATK